MAFGVMHTTNVHGKNYSFIYTDDIENGSLVNKGSLETDEQSVYKAEIPTTATLATEKIYIVGDPAWSYDDGRTVNQNEENYIVPAGKVFRVYDLEINDKPSISAYSFTGTPVKDHFVVAANNSTKPTVVATMPVIEDHAFIAKITEIRNIGFVYAVGSAGDVDNTSAMVTIEVIKNG